MEKQTPLVYKLVAYMLFFILLIYCLIQAKHILYPISFALLISYLLFPITSFLEERLKFPRALAILLVIVLMMSAFYGIIILMVTQVGKLMSDFPILKNQALLNLDAIQIFIENRFGITQTTQDVWIKHRILILMEDGNKILGSFIAKASGTLGNILLMPIFAFFMLFYRDRAQIFITKIIEAKRGKLTDRLLKLVSKVTIKYVSGIIIVVIILSISHSITLSIIGLKYAIVIGIISGMFSLIPYFGTLVGGVVPIFFAVLTHTNPFAALWILIYYIVIMFIDHNILTPTIVGGNVHLNPFITIISIIVGATVWGIPGMIVVVPVIAVIKIICDNIPSLEPWGYILGADSKNIVPFEKLKKLALKRQEKRKKIIMFNHL